MAKIEAIALYDLRGTRPSVIAPNAYAGIRPAESYENMLVLMTEDGLRGVTNWAHRARTASEAEHDLGWLVGVDPSDVFDWDGDIVTGRAPSFEQHLRTTPSLDVALLDLCGQILDRPLWQLLGKEVRTAVPAYDSSLYFEDLVDDDSGIENVVQKAKSAVERGHRSLKIKVGRGYRWMQWPESTERDIRVCHSVQEAVGPDIRLMVDGNHGYSGYVDDAVDFLAETERCDLVFAEELVRCDEICRLRDAMKQRNLALPLAGAEDATTANWCYEHWERCSLDILQMDMCMTGILEYLDIARFAQERQLKIAPHNFGSILGQCISAQLGKVIPEFLTVECDDSSFAAYSSAGYELKDGALHVPNSPGLGIIAPDPRTEPDG
jgi:L-alanine-DL-glutamate epimerase-like enolase superfamily enzyme